MQKRSKQTALYGLLLSFLSGCQRLDSIDSSPKISPENFLQNQHWVKIYLGNFSFVWSQPTSTIIVYFVGVFTIYAAYTFLSAQKRQYSTLWWGIGLLLTGLGALFAGTSYQAFGYEIKCSGRAFCTWTSWWEVIYMFLSVPGMNAFLIATAYTNAKGNFRKAIITYAIINTIGYSVLLIYGALFAVKFAVSFECMTLVSLPSVIFLLLLHGACYVKKKDNMNLLLLKVWLFFFCIIIAYETAVLVDITNHLWQKGIWFTENDVLHIGMFSWVYYLFKKLPDSITDLA